ncbi:uncharacterized protein LOC111616062 [Centruroides sculpturatus]|uniref:uncharacterized protein LOC111616062 n=1 Tax=Centruroides sculpturatus TaxID=218467 RepID=UPI000C6DCC01|nr:uncharacterized protein LOC111616062 [Centruroides sculpturatus]
MKRSWIVSFFDGNNHFHSRQQNFCQIIGTIVTNFYSTFIANRPVNKLRSIFKYTIVINALHLDQNVPVTSNRKRTLTIKSVARNNISAFIKNCNILKTFYKDTSVFFQVNTCNMSNSSEGAGKYKWIVYENDYLIAYLHSFPYTTGVTVVEIKNKPDFHIFALPIQEFVKIMLDIQHVSNLLCDRLDVQRCALIAEPQDGQPTKILLIPLHGLSDAWKPCICSEPEFNSCYPGYCTSKNGPRASDDELNKIQNKIRNKFDSQELNFKFYGDANDDNLFAKIVRGDEKAQWRVWEDEDHVAFLTPFPNTPGFTVLVPRKHLDSNIFALDKPDFEKLMVATHKVSNLLMKALEIKSCAMIFEGYEIDYAHVKLIPILHDVTMIKKPKEVEFNINYVGFVTSLNGPKANYDDLNSIHHKITTSDNVNS